MGFKATYFSAEMFDPRVVLARLAHPYRHRATVGLRGGELTIRWTSRAERALRRTRGDPLPVEMQLYFACVVKKRVLFPDRAPAHAVAVAERFFVHLTTVESDRCDPVSFAANYPVKGELTSAAANRMRARELLLDYRLGKWQGEFSV